MGLSVVNTCGACGSPQSQVLSVFQLPVAGVAVSHFFPWIWLSKISAFISSSWSPCNEVTTLWLCQIFFPGTVLHVQIFCLCHTITQRADTCLRSWFIASASCWEKKNIFCECASF